MDVLITCSHTDSQWPWRWEQRDLCHSCSSCPEWLDTCALAPFLYPHSSSAEASGSYQAPCYIGFLRTPAYLDRQCWPDEALLCSHNESLCTHFPEVIFHPKWKHVVGRGAYVKPGLLRIQVRLKLQFFVASKICDIHPFLGHLACVGHQIFPGPVNGL